MEKDTIDFNRPQPNTITSITRELRELGVSEGMTLLLHSSLSSLGWVCGGGVAVILALEQTLGEDGTLVMPAFTSELSEPSEWCNPPVPESWWQTIRDQMPPFNPDLTPTRCVGVIPETFRKQAGVLRSSHPNSSFSAWGKHKKYITENHNLDFSAGPKSPLGRIYQLDGYILLLGVDHRRNTSLHLAEYLSDYHKYSVKDKAVVDCFAPILHEGKRVWQKYQDIDFGGEDFQEIGQVFDETGKCRIGKIGTAEARLMRQRDLVDFAVEWMKQNR